MGFTKTIGFRGIEVPNAYHRIDVTSSAGGQCHATVNIYTTRQSFLDGEAYLEQLAVSYPISYGVGAGADKNQGYDYLMGSDEYAGAVPVFENGQPD